MTTPLLRLTGPAAPLFLPDINTDVIAPLARGAGGVAPAGVRTREELAARLFANWRYRADGSENPDFVLNRPPFRAARFLVAGPNFACGSSRETAATMLEAFGIRCVIAPSFGLIFFDNCFRNGMLPLGLEHDVVLAAAAEAGGGGDFRLDLEAMTLVLPSGRTHAFKLPAFRREGLMRGEDEISVTLARAPAIAAWQSRARAARPWEWSAGRFDNPTKETP